MKHPLTGAGVIRVELFEKFLCILTLCIAVYRAFAPDYRKFVFIFKSDNIHFIDKHKGADHGQIHSVQISSRRERVKPSFKDQREEHCLNDIVFVVRIRYFITTHLLDRLIESAFSHFGAEGTGIALFAYIEKNIIDFRFYDFIGNFHLGAELLDRRKIKAFKSKIYRDGTEIKFLRIETPETVECVEERQAVREKADETCIYI